MNILTKIIFSILSLPFGVVIFFPAIIISIILLVLIFYKNKKKTFNSIDTDNNILPVKEEDKKYSFLNYIFKKDQTFYHRYLAVLIFLLILLVGSYSQLFQCSYIYSTIVQITILTSGYVFFRLVKKSLVYLNIKFTRIIMLILVIITLLSYSYFFLSRFFINGFLNFSDSVQPACYGFYPPRETIDIIPIPEIPGLNINSEEKTNKTFKYDPNGPYPSPIVDIGNMINARGEVVDKWANGTFKRMDTNKIFSYREKYDFNPGSLNDYNGNAVNDCIKLNCKFIYFTSGGMALFNDIDDPAIGVIDKVTFISGGEEQSSSYVPNKLNDEVIYSITFTQDGKSGQVTTSTENICMGFKGGGFSCRAPFYSKGDKVIFVHNQSYGANYENRALFIDDTFKAELISYQYSMSPDTGEVFSVVQR